MTRLLLVRHAHPSVKLDRASDAGLDEIGEGQARALVAVLGPSGPLALVVSPMRRTRETVAPLAADWGITPHVEPAVSEIPSPIDEVAERGVWLREVLGGRWEAASPALHRWRSDLLETLTAVVVPTVVVTHYVAINAAVGVATGDDRLISFAPGHTSITELAVVGGELRLVVLGDEATTTIQ